MTRYTVVRNRLVLQESVEHVEADSMMDAILKAQTDTNSSEWHNLSNFESQVVSMVKSAENKGRLGR